MEFSELKIPVEKEGPLKTAQWNDLVQKVERLYFNISANDLKVGLGTDDPKEALQIGDKWAFHSGGHKVIMYNSYWNGTAQLRITDGPASELRFHSNGHMYIRTGPSDAAGTAVDFERTFSFGPSTNLMVHTKSGWMRMGVSDDGLARIETDRPHFYLNREIRVDSGKIGSHNESLQLCVNGSSKATVNTKGQLGIGTTSPTQLLTVRAKRPRIALAETGGNAGVLEYNEAADDLRLQWWSGHGTKFQKNLMQLNINGRVYIPGIRNIGDHKNVQWNASTKELGWDNSSRRDKENITPLEDDFKQVFRLQPRTYTRAIDPGRWEIGYIAEEADALGLKQLVYYDEEGRPDGFNYRKFCLYLLEILYKHEQQLNPDSPYLEKYTEESR